jgi:hypothetical protein
MATIPVKTNEATAARRRVYFQCVDATDGMAPEAGETGGQPQCSLDGETFTNTGIGVLVAVTAANGRYYAVLTQSKVNVADGVILTRYKSANTAECVGDTAVIDSRLDGITTLLTDFGGLADTNDVQAAVTAAILAAGFATDTDVAETLLNYLLSVGTDSGGRTVRNALRALVNKVAITGGTTMTVYKENDSTTAWTATVTTSDTADPIITIDPS